MENDLLEGQLNIFDVIKDFEPKDNKKRVKKQRITIPIAVKTEDWIKSKGVNNEDPKSNTGKL